MKPIGPLMREHRLIERMVSRIDAERRRLEGGGPVTPGFIEPAVDFFRTYADRLHHGKEEDILFKQLAAKNMSPGLAKIMDELIAEHDLARKLVGQLDEAGKEYKPGDAKALTAIKEAMAGLTGLYPKHIEKEDKHFFYPILEYLTKEEQDAMLETFREFDQSMIHEKYLKVAEGLGA